MAEFTLLFQGHTPIVCIITYTIANTNRIFPLKNLSFMVLWREENAARETSGLNTLDTFLWNE